MEAKIKNILSSHFFEGVVLILFGLIMLLWPSTAKVVISVLLGIILLILGALLVLGFLRSYSTAHPMSLFAGLLAFALGLEMIIHPSTFIVVVQVVMSITLIYSSILLILQAYRLRSERGTLFYVTIAFAVAALAFAVLILIKPLGVAKVFIQFKGFSLILEGLAALFVLRSHTPSGGYLDI